MPTSSKQYYDPEYDRVVGEDIIQKQYAWFVENMHIGKSYEEFRADNFVDVDFALEKF